MNTVGNKQFNLTTEDKIYFQGDSEGSIKSAQASSRQSLNSKINLSRVVSEPINYQKPQHNIKPVAPERSIIKTNISEIKNSRKRRVSFSTLLREVNIDITTLKEDSDSECEDYEAMLDVQDEEAEDEISKCVSKYTLKMQSLNLTRSRSLDIRPPTPPNTSHLLKPISTETPAFMIRPDAIEKENQSTDAS